ncbi:hypothetical protein GCM10010464_84200 [Pseudonocardia yunnanensis]|uniref:Uncharacterized protein n=1 Tax=Pseudonocardia yunnanensis TaxID=58107 RepID=A0ABW4F3L6_9PSEU
MSERDIALRSLHDLGLASWFGGSLAGAVAVNGAAGDLPDDRQRLRVACAGWARWAPVNLAAIVAYLAGATGLLLADKDRVLSKEGVGATAVAKVALTGVALGVTAYSGVLGRKLGQAEGVPVDGATDPSPDTPPDIASTQRQMAVCQWMVPALTAGLIVLDAVDYEKRRQNRGLPAILAKLARPLHRGN